jgi:hypothetical protein
LRTEFVSGEADLRMARDVVAEGEQLRLHELGGASDDSVSRRVRAGEAAYESRDVELPLERVHLRDHATDCLALGGCLLRGEWHGEWQGEWHGDKRQARKKTSFHRGSW